MIKERRRAVLTPRNRPHETFLAGMGIDEGIIGRNRLWFNRLEADARTWMARGSFGERGLITKGDADRIYRKSFGESKRNSLAMEGVRDD